MQQLVMKAQEDRNLLMSETAEINRLRNECFTLIQRLIDTQDLINAQSRQSEFSNPYMQRYASRSLSLMKQTDPNDELNQRIIPRSNINESSIEQSKETFKIATENNMLNHMSSSIDEV